MNSQPDFLSPTTVFVIRFSLEGSPEGVRWRGSIEHIPSGTRGVFLRVEELLKFWEKFNILLNEEGYSR